MHILTGSDCDVKLTWLWLWERNPIPPPPETEQTGEGRRRFFAASCLPPKEALRGVLESRHVSEGRRYLLNLLRVKREFWYQLPRFRKWILVLFWRRHGDARRPDLCKQIERLPKDDPVTPLTGSALGWLNSLSSLHAKFLGLVLYCFSSSFPSETPLEMVYQRIT